MASIESRHEHEAMGSSMVMAAGVPGLFYMQQIFWSFVGAAIATATIANVLNKFLYHQRISTSRKIPDPAKPRSLFFQTHATLSAIIREYSNYSMPLKIGKKSFYLPPMGPITMMLGYVTLIVVCCLYRLSPNNLLEWEDIGYRAGFIAVCQLPLIVLLSGKRNIIGLLTGMGYERLNWLHRWTARSLLLTMLIHIGFWFNEWGKFDYIMVKIKGDSITQKGVAAGSILLWIVVSSVAPIRGLSYQVFVVQHIISWLGFLVAIYMHVPDENRIWIWLPLGFWAFDRLVRASFLAWTNIGLFHGGKTALLSCKAVFEPLDENHTRITIPSPPINWVAGQHIFLTCHPLAPLSSHPFTITSLPSDGKLELIVRAKKGATRRFFRYASKPEICTGRSVLIEGPYSRIRPLRQFDSLVLIAGSTGATFTMPLLRDIVQNWTANKSTPSRRFSIEPPAGAVTRHIRFIWVIKRRSSLTWFAAHLNEVISTTAALKNEGVDVTVEISVYITCDEGLTSEKSSLRNEPSPPQRDSYSSADDEKKVVEEEIREVRSNDQPGECCCTRIVTDEDAIAPPCNCSGPSESGPRLDSCATSSMPEDKLVDSRITILGGRPDVRGIIRKSAEQALGEIAVVVCGPPGLVQCTRNAAVGVSDERAVHKGTGAQGIWVHGEVFGYA